MSVIASDIKLLYERLSGITLSDIARLIPDDLYPKKTRYKSGNKLYPVITKYVWTVVGHNSDPKRAMTLYDDNFRVKLNSSRELFTPLLRFVFTCSTKSISK